MILYVHHEIKRIDPSDIRTMIADYMGKRFFSKTIIDMYKYDSSLYTYIGELMKDEKDLLFRIGISALLDTLKTEDFKIYSKASFNSASLKDKTPFSEAMLLISLA